jgi:hypothetical protein
MKLLTVEGTLQRLAALLGLKPSENEEIPVQVILPRCQLNYRLLTLADADGANEESETISLVPPMPAPNPDWKWLSPTEEAILRAASATDWKKKEDIAKAAGLPCDRDFEAILRNMIERNMLESAPGRGFRLKSTS